MMKVHQARYGFYDIGDINRNHARQLADVPLLVDRCRAAALRPDQTTSHPEPQTNTGEVDEPTDGIPARGASTPMLDGNEVCAVDDPYTLADDAFLAAREARRAWRIWRRNWHHVGQLAAYCVTQDLWQSERPTAMRATRAAQDACLSTKEASDIVTHAVGLAARTLSFPIHPIHSMTHICM